MGPVGVAVVWEGPSVCTGLRLFTSPSAGPALTPARPQEDPRRQVPFLRSLDDPCSAGAPFLHLLPA